MTAKLPLPLHALAPFSDRNTSLEAARAIGPQLQRLQHVVLDAIRARGGLCAFQIEDWTGLGGNTVRPRLRELAMRGLIRDSGRTGLTRSGRRAVIWEAT